MWIQKWWFSQNWNWSQTCSSFRICSDHRAGCAFRTRSDCSIFPHAAVLLFAVSSWSRFCWKTRGGVITHSSLQHPWSAYIDHVHSLITIMIMMTIMIMVILYKTTKFSLQPVLAFILCHQNHLLHELLVVTWQICISWTFIDLVKVGFAANWFCSHKIEISCGEKFHFEWNSISVLRMDPSCFLQLPGCLAAAPVERLQMPGEECSQLRNEFSRKISQTSNSLQPGIAFTVGRCFTSGSKMGLISFWTQALWQQRIRTLLVAFLHLLCLVLILTTYRRSPRWSWSPPPTRNHQGWTWT